jgi:hypothetical protein
MKISPIFTKVLRASDGALSPRSLSGVRLSTRQLSTYQSEASQTLQAQTKSVQAEHSIYSESQVSKEASVYLWRACSQFRIELQKYTGGCIRLAMDDASGVAQLTIENAEAKNAMTGMV